MTITLDIPEDLRSRVEAIAARSSLSASEIIADALEHGHSLEWQERYLDLVSEGIAAAERGDFAAADELASVVNKYRPS